MLCHVRRVSLADRVAHSGSCRHRQSIQSLDSHRTPFRRQPPCRRRTRQFLGLGAPRALRRRRLEWTKHGAVSPPHLRLRFSRNSLSDAVRRFKSSLKSDLRSYCYYRPCSGGRLSELSRDDQVRWLPPRCFTFVRARTADISTYSFCAASSLRQRCHIGSLQHPPRPTPARHSRDSSSALRRRAPTRSASGASQALSAQRVY